MLDIKAQQDTIITINNDTIFCEILDNIDGHIVYRKVGKLTGDAIAPDSILYMSRIIDNKEAERNRPNKEIFPFINISFGYGSNYGITGTKTVIGLNNSGILIGLGYSGVPGIQIGAQLGNESIYTNIGYGTVGWYQAKKTRVPFYGATFFAGGMINVGNREHIYIDLGIGYIFGEDIKTNQFILYVEGITIGIGIAFRFDWKKQDIQYD